MAVMFPSGGMHTQFLLYWFSVPAILKDWMDRALCQGFAFNLPGIYDTGFLKGKEALLSLTTGLASEKEREKMVTSWTQWLKTIWTEEPITCTSFC
ncbi:ribosyldihydronicotinamide dehydrogenase [quinone]-like [Rhynchocyon petersi]